MDKRIRRNELCVIGLPRCDYVFSSTRTCFIGYGFQSSSLEMGLIQTILRNEGVEPIEASGQLAPAQNAFCAKICSKIITSQFCVVLINNDVREGRETPNANVNMEYGLMLGFNKYIIPFQRMEQSLCFNLAGLDTVKYTNQDFHSKATMAIRQAIKETAQDSVTPDITPKIDLFILLKRQLVTPLNTDGDRTMFQLGNNLGFNLLNDHAGLKYKYLGIFTAIAPELIVWRLRLLNEMLESRRAAAPRKIDLGIATTESLLAFEEFFAGLGYWVIVTSEYEKTKVLAEIGPDSHRPMSFPLVVYSLADVDASLSALS